MGKLRLPRLISHGMVLQQKKKIHIWGWDEPGRNVCVSFLCEDYVARADENGRFDLWMKESRPGGPYNMQIHDDDGCEIVIRDILVGDVWLCSGQSNMELPMARVIDSCPEELEECENSFIRTFKIIEHTDFHAPAGELLTGEWKQPHRDSLLEFSAVAYFFAKQLYSITKIPVGLINASLGGSRIESWMSREMLQGYDDFLELAKRYSDDSFIEGQRKKNERQSAEYHTALDLMDKGLREHWELEETDESLFKPIKLPGFFRDSELRGFNGCVWFRRNFKVPGSMVGARAKVWLGTIVDSDTVYINGVQAGHTDYQYPPRKYEIPEGVLKQDNVIAIRVKVDHGEGRFTPGKRCAVFNENGEAGLWGTWKYRIGAECEFAPETDFVNWKPTGLYNGMTAPCHAYTIGGIIWYQGEANTSHYDSYYDLTRRMVEGYRREWKDDSIPFIFAQLPNFEIDLVSSTDDVPGIVSDGFNGGKDGSGWPQVREQQRRSLDIPSAGMIVTIDVGEDNDLHPINKKDIGKRFAAAALNLLYSGNDEYLGPQVEEIRAGICSGGKARAELQCRHVKGGMYASSADKGNVIKDFELLDNNACWHNASAELADDKIILTCEEMTCCPVGVRYCYSNTNRGALVYNNSGFPMSPFAKQI